MHAQVRIRKDARGGAHESRSAEVTWDQLRLAMVEICKAVSDGLRDKHDSARQCMQRASAILRIDPWFAQVIEEFDLPSQRRSKFAVGGLAPGQIRQITRYIEGNLAATIRIRELAAIVRVSPSHFSRAFKESFADTPHRYVMRRRMERAQALMLTTDASLGRIATECGFSDQPHFNRLFRRLFGDRPRAWRREREYDLHDRHRWALESPGFRRLKSFDDTEADGERPRRRHCLDEIGVLRLNG
jgi:AraC family transcriptional regulator